MGTKLIKHLEEVLQDAIGLLLVLGAHLLHPARLHHYGVRAHALFLVMLSNGIPYAVCRLLERALRVEVSLAHTVQRRPEPTL
eukprot:2113515-Pleurochrysis_carterae.AAC.5